MVVLFLQTVILSSILPEIQYETIELPILKGKVYIRARQFIHKGIQ